MLAFSMTQNKKLRNSLKLLTKLMITAACFWYVSRKIDVNNIYKLFGQVNIQWLAAAIAAFLFSKLLSAIRLNIYFEDIGIRLPFIKNVKLYWLSMFYNIFLPGSISGDAYKVIRLTKQYQMPYKKTAAAVLLDRFSGLFALILLLSLIWMYVFDTGFYSWWIMSGAIGCVPLFFFAVKFYFPWFLKNFTRTYLWAIGVQVFQVVCMLAIIKGLHISRKEEVYVLILIFMVSSVVAVLPFTIGGLGAREMVFLWGAEHFNLDTNAAVMASVLFYLTTLVSSAFGLPLVFSDPLKD